MRLNLGDHFLPIYGFMTRRPRWPTTAGMQEVEQRRSSCREPGWTRTVTHGVYSAYMMMAQL